MEELLKYILESIVSNVDDLNIEKEENEEGNITFNVSVHEDDKGLIIGKAGRNIKAIRDVLSIIAIKERKKVYIKVLD